VSYSERAIEQVLDHADRIYREGQSLMIIRDVTANETGRWLMDMATEMRAACTVEDMAVAPSMLLGRVLAQWESRFSMDAGRAAKEWEELMALIRKAIMQKELGVEKGKELKP
jgi:hypothetical protein